MTDTKFERTIKIIPAYDKRKESNGKYGRHNAVLWFCLKGELGAITASFNTGWDIQWDDIVRGYMPYGGVAICTHKLTQTEEHEVKNDNCEWLDGRTCYGDVSYTASDEVFNQLLTRGDEAVWEELEQWYSRYMEVGDDE